MNPRERQLALAVGALFALMALWFGWSYIDSQFRARRQQIDTLDREIATLRRQTTAGQMATRKLVEYEARSLPPQPQLARSLYQSWLLAEIGKAGFAEPEIRAQTQQEVRAPTRTKEGSLYVKHPFEIGGKATLPQVVDFLYAFYRADYLHRINNLQLKPIKDSKQLEVSMTIDAASLSAAPPAAALHNRTSDRLALKTKDEYYDKIVGRNLFGPPNRAPSLSISGSKEVRLNREAQLSAKGTDPDPLDRVKYRLVESAAPEAKFNEGTGQFSWTPKQLGKYKFVFEAVDDGFPARPSRREEIVLNVTEAPVEAPVTGFRGFDAAKFTVLVGVTEVDGAGEVWLHNRPKGQVLKLREGDAFEIGSIKGVVASIGQTEFTFTSDGKLRKLEKGATLEQASVQPQASESTPTLRAVPQVEASLRTGSSSPQPLAVP